MKDKPNIACDAAEKHLTDCKVNPGNLFLRNGQIIRGQSRTAGHPINDSLTRSTVAKRLAPVEIKAGMRAP